MLYRAELLNDMKDRSVEDDNNPSHHSLWWLEYRSVCQITSISKKFESSGELSSLVEGIIVVLLFFRHKRQLLLHWFDALTWVKKTKNVLQENVFDPPNLVFCPNRYFVWVYFIGLGNTEEGTFNHSTMQNHSRSCKVLGSLYLIGDQGTGTGHGKM